MTQHKIEMDITADVTKLKEAFELVARTAQAAGITSIVFGAALETLKIPSGTIYIVDEPSYEIADDLVVEVKDAGNDKMD